MLRELTDETMNRLFGGTGPGDVPFPDDETPEEDPPPMILSEGLMGKVFGGTSPDIVEPPDDEIPPA